MSRQAVVVALALLAACADPGPHRDHVDALFALDARAAAPAAPAAALVVRGAQLFTERRGGVACSDCHDPGRHGQDGAVHGRATPALADVARQLLFGWDGATTTLDAMVARELRQRCGIEQPKADEVAALAAWLATWRTRGRWDRYVEGDDGALTPFERHGLRTFLEVGCAACHAGRNLGGRSRHVLGAAQPAAAADTGLHAATGRAADRFAFRAPMLRLAAATPPYLHDGSLADLDATVRFMARHGLGRDLDDAQVAAIVGFLRATADVGPGRGLSTGEPAGSPMPGR